MGWSGENFHKANIFMNPPDAGYDPFAFSVSNRLILVKTLLYFQYKLTNFGKRIRSIFKNFRIMCEPKNKNPKN